MDFSDVYHSPRDRLASLASALDVMELTGGRLAALQRDQHGPVVICIDKDYQPSYLRSVDKDLSALSWKVQQAAQSIIQDAWRLVLGRYMINTGALQRLQLFCERSPSERINELLGYPKTLLSRILTQMREEHDKNVAHLEWFRKPENDLIGRSPLEQLRILDTMPY